MDDIASSPSRVRLLAGALAALVALSAVAYWPTAGATATAAGVRVAPLSAYNPVLAGERLPADFRQILPRDAIQPVYDPVFTSPDGVNWPESTDVIGVEINGEAKAYPIDFLNGRELVVDELGGIPILVSW